MKNEPTPAELIATATRLLAAAQRSLKKKPARRPRPARRIPEERIATAQEVAAAFAQLRAELALLP